MTRITTALLLLPSAAFASFNLLTLPDGPGLPELPAGTTENPACIAAYNATIDCDPTVITNTFESTTDGPTVEELDKICTPGCLTSLRKWVRGGEGCEGETYLNYFGLMSDDFFDGNVTTTTVDVWQYYITAAYHSKCMRDFSTSANTYCILSPDSQGFAQPAILNTSNPDALCKNNVCGTQSAYLFAPIKTIYKFDTSNTTGEDREEGGRDSNGDLPMITLEEACPGIDTSEYPLREEDVTAEMLKSGSTGGNSSGDKPNAAAGGVSVSFGNVAVAAVVGILGFLAL
ncbi:hypothetical protein TWF730_004469 [Orbilia blumenaviensis]|uniref:Uncharacterized protein n=1 Tax=Orbilia blumenaviensis TaxID=1796055 RepID=A0AAV9TZ57_9PEZI